MLVIVLPHSIIQSLPYLFGSISIMYKQIIFVADVSPCVLYYMYVFRMKRPPLIRSKADVKEKIVLLEVSMAN